MLRVLTVLCLLVGVSGSSFAFSTKFNKVGAELPETQQNTAIAQLDSDAALELITYGTDRILIVDCATGDEEYSYITHTNNDIRNVGIRTAIGDIDADGLKEVVISVSRISVSGEIPYLGLIVVVDTDVADVCAIDGELEPTLGLNLRRAPEPCSSDTKIGFDLAKKTDVTVRILDVSGRLVRELESGELDAGPYTLSWDAKDRRGNDVPSGVYLVRLNAGGEIASTRLTLVR